jgi:transposase
MCPWSAPAGPVPHRHWKTANFVAGLQTTGITAPDVLHGTMKGAIFRVYDEQIFVPTLGSGDIVVMNNLPFHKITGIRKARLLDLPLYNPDLNPVEQAFAKLQVLLRKERERIRNGL